MKKAGAAVEKIGQKAVKLFIFLMMAGFLLETARYTYRLDYDYLSDIVYRFEVSAAKQLLYLAAMLAFLYAVQKLILRGSRERQEKLVRYITAADLLAVGIGLIVYVSLSHIPPHWDQLQVFYYAQDFLSGNYEGMQFAYLRIYTQQYGLIFLEELLLNIWNDYRIFQYINVLFILLTIYMTERISDELFHSPRVNLYSLFGVTLFLPLHIYVNYVYGDLCSIAMVLTAVWAMLRFCREQRRRDMALAVLVLTIGVLARKNTLIPVIAMLLACILCAWKKRNLRILLFGLAITVVPLAGNEAVLAYYEHVSGYEIAEGIPASAWIAMGLSDDGNGGVGLFNGYGEAVWNAVDGDCDKVGELAAENIRERLGELADDRKEAWEFFRYKIFEQWGEPCFSSINETGKGIDEKKGIVALIYSDRISDMIYRYMNHHLFLIYAGVLAFALSAMNKRNDITELTLLIAVAGGFIYSVFWEAKGKYVMPFVIFMIPYMAAGIDSLNFKVRKMIDRSRRTAQSEK